MNWVRSVIVSEDKFGVNNLLQVRWHNLWDRRLGEQARWGIKRGFIELFEQH